MPIVYKGIQLGCGYRLDIVVQGELIVEIKAVDQLLPIHDAQLLTYLRLSGHKVGLLMNFNTVLLKDGSAAWSYENCFFQCSLCLCGELFWLGSGNGRFCSYVPGQDFGGR